MKNKIVAHPMFDGRKLVIATMHKKENVISPIVTKQLGAKCITIPALDTDRFGTFSGEIARKSGPMQTVRMKAFAALKLCDATLVIASEGSFGNHPESIFLPINEELIILIDVENQLEIIGRHLTIETNHNKRAIKTLEDLEEFREEIGYPEHGLILKIENLETNVIDICKDFKNPRELEEITRIALANNSIIHAETDMRAMNNPTRMKAIEKAVHNLIQNCNSACPNCNSPGFSIQEPIPGLPCELCRFPTKSTKAYQYHCQKCDFTEERLKEGPQFQYATFCDRCNP